MHEWEACEQPLLEPSFYNPRARLHSVLLRASCSFSGAAQRKHSGWLLRAWCDVGTKMFPNSHILKFAEFHVSSPFCFPFPSTCSSPSQHSPFNQASFSGFPSFAHENLGLLSQAQSGWSSSFSPPQSAMGVALGLPWFLYK